MQQILGYMHSGKIYENHCEKLRIVTGVVGLAKICRIVYLRDSKGTSTRYTEIEVQL